MKLELGKCEILEHTQYINQQKCEILKRIVCHLIYGIPKEVVDNWQYFNYEFGINLETNEIETLVIFNGFQNALDYYHFSPIPVILLYYEYQGIEKFIKKVEPFIRNDIGLYKNEVH